jgi:transmembrane sensor
MSAAHDPARAAIRSDAAQWFNLRRSGDMTVDDEQRFREWLALSESHHAAYERVGRAWAIAGTAAADPELRAAAEPAPVEDIAPRRERWRFLAMAASLVLVVTLGWALLPKGLFGPPATDPQEQVFRTGTGQRTMITLPDRSVVTLDAETVVRLDLSPAERRVELVGGRAFFRVAKDPTRPFVVVAGGKSVRALGTAFEVSFDHGNMVVTLAEGKVRVAEVTPGRGPGNSTDMVPGGQLAIGADHNWTLSRVDVEKETSWTEGRLIFMGDRLADAVAEMNRYSERKLVFKDGAIPDREVVGVFKSGDVDGFVTAMELNGIAHRIESSGSEILLSGNP